MNTSVFSKLAAICALFFLMLAPATTSKAQIAMPYQVHNTTLCSVEIKFTIFEKNAVGACNVACFAGNVMVPAGAIINLPMWPNYPICGCGIEICIVGALGRPIPAICAGWPAPMVPNNIGPDPTGCSPSGMFSIMVGPAAAVITP